MSNDFDIGAERRAQREQTQRELDELVSSRPGFRVEVSIGYYGLDSWRVEVHHGNECVASADCAHPSELRATVEKALATP